MGRPPEHIKEALNALIGKLGLEKGVKVLESKMHEPALVKDTKDIYTAFAEISIEFDSLTYYFGVLFAYMPAHIEIISPENLQLSNFELNDLGNKLLLRLHDYDALTKNFLYEKKFLTRKLYELAPHLFKNPEEMKKKTAKEKKESKSK
jgi:hypothetical protein